MKTIAGLRWWIIALVCAGTIVNYLSRNSLGVMAPQLMGLLHMSTRQYSYVVGAFQIGYTVMQPVCGLIIDLIGLRLGFALFACLWSNVQYAPGNGSLFSSKAVFNTYGVVSTYRITPSVTVGAGYSYTRASRANGIDDAARYQQISLEQTYSLSARTTLYALQAYQHARGKALITTGSGATSIADAVAVVGDSQNTTPSSGPSQFVGMVGLRHAF